MSEEATVRVVVGWDDDGYWCRTYDEYPVIPPKHMVHEIPAAQCERWRTAEATWKAVQAEIEAFDRSH